MLTLLSGLLAAACVALVVRPPPRLRRSRARPPALVLPVLLAALVLAPPRTAVLGAIAVATALGAGALVRRRTSRGAAERTADRVLETCELVAGELAAGQPPGTVLARAARAWPDLGPVAESHQLGGDVPAALRVLATRPGADDLRLLAAAWVVSHRTGGGLADAVRRTALSIRRHRASARVVEGELASARATARLVAALPLLVLVMGSGSGGDPVAFLLGSPVGNACLAAGLALGLAGLAWIERIADDARGSR